jgi:MFS family permease
MMGTWMQQMAQGWVLASLTTSALALGWVNFASGVPMLLLTMYGGVIADRFDKRLVIIAALVAQSILALVLGWLVGSGQIQVWHVVAAGIFWGIAAAFEMPSAAAIVPELVEKHEMSAAIAVDRSVFHATRLAGPALGGWLIGMMGTAAAFYVNAASFSALIVALLTIRPRVRTAAEDEERRQTGMKEGLQYVRSDAPTMRMILLLALSTLFISPFFMIMMPLYSMHVLQLGAPEHGILMAASGLGAFTGSLLLLAIPAQVRQRILSIDVVVIALAMVGLSRAHGLAPAVVCMVALTLGTSTLFGLANTLVQERAPDFIRGRVSAVAGLSFFGVLPFAGLLTAQVADVIGLRTALISAGICYGAIGTLVLLRREKAS